MLVANDVPHHQIPENAEMNDTPNQEPTRQLNCSALRTLHALERTLNRQIHELMAIGCEDAAAADATLFAVESAEKALENTRVAKKNLHGAAGRDSGR